MRTSDSVENLFKRNIESRGLSLETAPEAVKMTIMLVQQFAEQSPFMALLSDLPASARAWEWMDCVFSAYAEWCSHTIVVDEEAQKTEPETAPEEPKTD